MIFWRYIQNAVLAAIPVLAVLGRWEPYFRNLTYAESVLCFIGGLALMGSAPPPPKSGVKLWYGRLSFLVPTLALLASGWFWCGGALGFALMGAEAGREKRLAEKKESEAGA